MVDITEFDIFYLSYDEPKKEEFYAKLQDIAPWIKRVDGVTGFDNAHKACARDSETEYFITVDGDNLVDPKFFDESIPDDKLSPNIVYSWNAKNHVNGLVYGNGGLKLWPKQLVLDMKTHENAEKDTARVDFCWEENYVQMNNCYCTTYPNQSIFQAFRSGFREGVKMSLDQGETVDYKEFEQKIYTENFQKLLIWASVGKDVENGCMTILGTRMGCYLTNLDEDFDFNNIADYNWFRTYFDETIKPLIAGDDNYCQYEDFKWAEYKVDAFIEEYGSLLRQKMNLPVAELDENQSIFFKKVYNNPRPAKVFTKETEMK